MFVRKKKNVSGKISVQVIDKSSGKYKVIKTIGSSDNPTVVEDLFKKGQQWIRDYLGIIELDFNGKTVANKLLDNIESITVSGTDLLLNNLYSQIGFEQIDNELFKRLVFSRIIFPTSKLKTSDLLSKFQDITVNVQKLYRYLDRLYTQDKKKVQEISYQQTKKILGNRIAIVFYDVTTLYFEIDDEDEIRKRGFSKDGRHQNPQLVLGLLVSKGGYPLAYDIFEGNKFEGHTMLPVIDKFKKKYKLEQLIIVADSGLLSKKNIEQLQTKGYEFIVGARIKNESKEIKGKILSLNLSNGQSAVIKKEGLSLIISYSADRAKKDKFNRQRGLKRLEKQIKSGRLTKANINNRGYNKYLKLDGDVKISIDKEKFDRDKNWDGLKGYITNTDLDKDSVIENYRHLWKIEKAFRISKHDLKIRPIYHRKQDRIEAHIIICFTAYKIYKELERILEIKGAKLSPEKAIEIAKTIYSIKIRIPESNEYIEKTLFLTDEQRYLANLFDL